MYWIGLACLPMWKPSITRPRNFDCFCCSFSCRTVENSVVNSLKRFSDIAFPPCGSVPNARPFPLMRGSDFRPSPGGGRHALINVSLAGDDHGPREFIPCASDTAAARYRSTHHLFLARDLAPPRRRFRLVVVIVLIGIVIHRVVIVGCDLSVGLRLRLGLRLRRRRFRREDMFAARPRFVG